MIIDTIISLYIFYNLIVIILVSATIDVQCILIRLEELVYWKITYILSFHPWTIMFGTLYEYFSLCIFHFQSMYLFYFVHFSNCSLYFLKKGQFFSFVSFIEFSRVYHFSNQLLGDPFAMIWTIHFYSNFQRVYNVTLEVYKTAPFTQP